MKRRSVWTTLLCLAAVGVLGLAAAPAEAVVGGTQDVNDTYSNVGMVLARDNGGWGVGASCTLVRNDAGHVAVLTAAHVAEAIVGAGGLGLENVRVTFDPLTDYDASALPLAVGSFTAYRVVAAKMHPDWNGAPSMSNSKRIGIGPGREDVALLWLDRSVPDVAAASIAVSGALDGLDLQAETFTVVGYGFNDDPVGNLMAWQNPNFALTWSGRNYAYGTGVTNQDAFGDRYLKLTPCGNAGDSGGPVFHDGKIVALTVWGGNRAESPNYDYRMDTTSAQDFVNYWLLHGPPK